MVTSVIKYKQKNLCHRKYNFYFYFQFSNTTFCILIYIFHFLENGDNISGSGKMKLQFASIISLNVYR